mgnify:FL=1
MAYVDGGVEIRYLLHLETTGNEIEYVALYIETGSEIRGSSGRVRRVRADGAGNGATTGNESAELGQLHFLAAVVLARLAGDDSGG